MGTTQADRRRQRRRRPADRPAVTREQQAWIDLRDRVGGQLDDFMRTRPSTEMRQAIRELEAALAFGDHAAGLL